MRALAPALLTCLLAGSALAAPVHDPPTDVSPVTVMPKTEPPKVAATFPAAGQAVASGVLVLRVTFDQQMLKSGFDFSPAAAGETPECLKTPRLLDDGKSFVLLCRTRPGRAYALSFNARPAGGFANLADNRAQAATLTFATTAEEPVRDLKGALKMANLRAIDAPVQDTPGYEQR